MTFGFFPTLIVASVVAFAGFNAVTYYRATGTIMQRLAACGSGSLTIFVGAWGMIATVLVSGLDMLANVTSDPLFAQWADAVKNVIPAQYHPVIPVVALSATMLARMRTLGK